MRVYNYSLRFLFAAICLSATNTFAADKVDQLIIKFKPQIQARMSGEQTQLRAVRAVNQVTGLPVSYKRPMANAIGSHVLKLPHEMSVEEAKQYAEQVTDNNAALAYIQPDYRYQHRLVPNDPEQSNQWWIQNSDTYAGATNLFKAWDITTGKGAVAAVIDSGYRPHADLVPNIVGQYDFTSDPATSIDGDGRDSDASDPSAVAGWHGTHVAGIIAAKGNNNIGIAGAAFDASLIIARASGTEGFATSDIIDSMIWAAGLSTGSNDAIPVNLTPAKILNMSLGGNEACTQASQDAIDQVSKAGVVTVVAAGNDNFDMTETPQDPAGCNGVISVAALAKDGARASFSNFGPQNDIAAPGAGILSTFNTGTDQPGTDSYKEQDGTSMSTPVVSGVIALMMSANKKLMDGTISASTVPDLIEQKIKNSARAFPTNIVGSSDPRGCTNPSNANPDLPEQNCVCATNTCGAGLLDAHQAVLAVSTAPTANAGADQTVTQGATVTLDASGSTDDAYNKGTDSKPVLTYAWEQTAGTSVTLSGTDSAKPTFAAPASATTVTFSLVVKDDTGLSSAADTVSIQVSGGNNNEGGSGSVGASGNDLILLQAAGNTSVVSGGEGNDRYIVSESLIGANQALTISDTFGNNTLHVVNGLNISSSQVTSSAVLLTLGNGAKITLLSADTFGYLVGGDALTGVGGTTLSFSDFVTQILGFASVPAVGVEPVTGGGKVIGG